MREDPHLRGASGSRTLLVRGRRGYSAPRFRTVNSPENEKAAKVSLGGSFRGSEKRSYWEGALPPVFSTLVRDASAWLGTERTSRIDGANDFLDLAQDLAVLGEDVVIAVGFVRIVISRLFSNAS